MIINNSLYSDSDVLAIATKEVPWHFVPGAGVMVHGTLEYPVITPTITRAKLKGGESEDYVIDVETCVAYSRESQVLIAGCLSWMMEFRPNEFKQILKHAQAESDRLGENNFEDI